MKIITNGLAALALATLLAGCGMTRDEIALTRPATPAASTTTASTATANAQLPAIKIVSVDDQRDFFIDPKTPDKPSLHDDAIHDKAITSRAIGRRRNAFGAAAGDLVLPQGETVSAHVGAVLADGFRQAGYRVLNSGDAGYDQAVPVKAVIKQYWTWIEVSIDFRFNGRTEIELDSPLPALNASRIVGGHVEFEDGMAFDSDWRKINEQNLQELSKQTAAMLAKQGG